MGLRVQSFFLKAEVCDGALDAPQADREMGLTEPLGDDLGGGIRIQGAVAHDLEDGLFGASVIGLGAGLLGDKGLQAALLEVMQELIIPLAAAAVLLRDGCDAALQTLAFHEHEEAVGLLVGGRDGQGAPSAGQLVSLGVELEGSVHGERVAESGVVSSRMWQPGKTAASLTAKNPARQSRNQAPRPCFLSHRQHRWHRWEFSSV